MGDKPMKAKPITPYQRLLDDFREYAGKVECRRRKPMFFIPKNRLSEGWRVDDIYERTAAAEQLGYDVILIADLDGLRIRYIEKVPPKPWNV
jgi:hypothetical protein